MGLTPHWVCQERHPCNTLLADKCALWGELWSRLLADRAEEGEEDEWCHCAASSALIPLIGQ